MYTYFIILFFTVLFPLVYSFERKRFSFYLKWKFLFTSIFATAFLFVVWDYYFTKWGVWEFNPECITGIKLAGLPLEEILFFIAVPFSCMFIYEVVNYFYSQNVFSGYSVYITLAISAFFSALAVIYSDRLYTAAAFSVASVVLLLHIFLYGNEYIERFFITYLFHLIPFFIVNGLLTYIPVVVYNNNENIGIRMGSIPIEDSVYSLSLLLINITIYEKLKKTYHYKIKYNA